MNMPIIRLEVQGMKHTITHALMEHQTQMDEDIQKAVEDYCSEENISRVITQACRAELEQAIKEEVSSFFRYGDGRKAIKAAVGANLMAQEEA